MVNRSLKDQASIVGIGHTEYSKDSGRSELQLACEAISAAVEDAGLSPADIDGITKYNWDNNDPVHIAQNGRASCKERVDEEEVAG